MPPKPLHVLICPLDWGLGHASRCIPVIKQLMYEGHKVTLAGYGRSLILLQQEFPLLESVELQGFSPSYPRSGEMVIQLLLLLPQFVFIILREHRLLKKLNKKYHFDIVISDNRYGLWNTNTTSVLITHQVMIKTPGWLRFAEYPLYLVSRLLLSRFDECWIPDYPVHPGLSGDLSHKYPIPGNAKFIGPLSRFQPSEKAEKKYPEKQIITAIISGPEPQRTIFEEIITKQLHDLDLAATLLCGKPDERKSVVTGSKLTILSHLETNDLQLLIASSTLIICRSGYSSIMDLNVLGAKALFVPTPGQTEQIYLAQLHEHTGTALWRTQEKMNLKTDIAEALKYKGFDRNDANISLETAITGLKKK
jgi:uncharacterized protein (TIGR00661 family)